MENPKLGEKMINLVEKPTDKIKILFIPTAANVEENKAYVQRDIEGILKLGILKENLIMYDLDEDVDKINLEDIDIIYIEGGNTFYLLDRVRKTGFDNKIKELVSKGVVYVGVSAGSILVGPDIRITEADLNNVGITDFRGLSLISRVISPHINREKYKNVNRYNDSKEKVVSLADGEALLVIDGKEEIIK